MEGDTLSTWNALPPEAAAEAILPCCGSYAWARALTGKRPLHSADHLIQTAAEVWRQLPEPDWHEAFRSHPRIGERRALGHTSAQAAAWSVQEQRAATGAGDELRDANRLYEERFGHIFLICASGKSAEEILAALQVRLGHDAAAELLIAADEQRRITELRLRRWLEGDVR